MKLPSLSPGLLSLLVAAAGVLATGGAWHSLRGLERQAAHDEFEALFSPVFTALQSRLQDNEQLLRGTSGLFAADPGATRAQWRNYLYATQLDDLPPGTNAIGYVRLTPRGDIDRLVESMHREGLPAFEVYPRGQRELYAPIVYVEPFAGRIARVPGFDILTDPARRAAAEAARDTGEARVTSALQLTSESEAQASQQGVVLYLPVYANGLPLNTLVQRQQAVTGYVYTSLRLEDVLRSVSLPAAGAASLTLYDGRDARPGALLAGDAEPADAAPGPARAPLLRAERELWFGGRVWTLHAASTLSFEAAHRPRRAALALLAGAVGTGLLAWLALVLARQRRQAWRLAARVRHARQTDGALQRAGLASASDAFLVCGADGGIQIAGAAASALFGRAPDQFAGTAIATLLPDAATLVATGPERRAETRACKADGTFFPVRVVATPVPAAGPGRVLWVVTDLSAVRRAELAATEAAGRSARVLDHTALCVITFDRDGIVTDINRAGQRMLWYQASEVAGRMRYLDFLDPREVAARAVALTSELGEPVAPGLPAVIGKARLGLADEQEWTYVRKGGSGLPVQLTLTALPAARTAAGADAAAPGMGAAVADGMPASDAGGYLAIAHDLTERKRADEYIRHLAHHDALTGLPNRAQLHARTELVLQRALRKGERIALLLLDLDQFKRINESLGHHMGDEVLRIVADRLKAAVRHADMVARMGGDEFVVVLDAVSQDSEAELVAAKILERLSEDLQLGSQRLRVTPSIGMAICPDDGDNLADLLKNADAAMYAAKRRGGAQLSRFSSEMAEASMARFTIEGLLRRALAAQAFKLRYQPIVDAASLRIVGVEALIHWNTPERGVIPPAEFIPIAEQSGLIMPLGEWILATACREIQQLRAELGLELEVAVNISPLQLRQAGFPAMVKQCLTAAGLPAGSLTIEVTEGILIEGGSKTIDTFERVRALGVGLSIDDFGTGYSGLSYLTRLPIDKLKIDKSFVDDVAHDEHDQAVAAAIITLGHQLHLQVVAEGVESPGQFAFLREHGCDAVQGYLFCQAVPLSGLMEICAAGGEAIMHAAAPVLAAGR